MLPRGNHTVVIVPGLRGPVRDHWQSRRKILKREVASR
jgi:hypothetical protein